MMIEDSSQQLNWLIESLVERIPEARCALLSAADGLKRASTEGLSKDKADKMSAITSGLWSLGRGAGSDFADTEKVRQVIVELEGAMLFVVAAGFGTILSVLTNDKANPGLVGHEMDQLVRSMHKHLETAARAEQERAAAASVFPARAGS